MESGEVADDAMNFKGMKLGMLFAVALGVETALSEFFRLPGSRDYDDLRAGTADAAARVSARTSVLTSSNVSRVLELSCPSAPAPPHRNAGRSSHLRPPIVAR
jgi:hypothetical protein